MYKRILVPVDGSETSQHALRHAVALSLQQRATLRLLHVVDDYAALMRMTSAADGARLCGLLREQGEVLLDRARRAAEQDGANAHTVLLEVAHRRPADVIVEEAESADCDLIVMGTHGRRGWRHLMLGSEAEAVVRASARPVLLLRLPGVATATVHDPLQGAAPGVIVDTQPSVRDASARVMARPS